MTKMIRSSEGLLNSTKTWNIIFKDVPLLTVIMCSLHMLKFVSSFAVHCVNVLFLLREWKTRKVSVRLVETKQVYSNLVDFEDVVHYRLTSGKEISTIVNQISYLLFISPLIYFESKLSHCKDVIFLSNLPIKISIFKATLTHCLTLQLSLKTFGAVCFNAGVKCFNAL